MPVTPNVPPTVALSVTVMFVGERVETVSVPPTLKLPGAPTMFPLESTSFIITSPPDDVGISTPGSPCSAAVSE